MNSAESGEVGSDQTEWRPWLYRFLMVPNLVGFSVVAVVAIAYRLEGLCDSNCLDRGQYWRGVLVLTFFAYLVKYLEKLWHKLTARHRS